MTNRPSKKIRRRINRYYRRGCRISGGIRHFIDNYLPYLKPCVEDGVLTKDDFNEFMRDVFGVQR